MAASQSDPVGRYVETIDPTPQRTYRLQRPDQHHVEWGCPDCPGRQGVAVVTRRDARDGAAVEAWLRCPECQFARQFRLTHHALQRWRERVGRPVHALRALVEGIHVGRPHTDQPARIHPPTAALLPVNIHGDEVVARTVKRPIYGRGRLETGHLERCRACRQAFDPARTAACPWCQVSIDYQTASTEEQV
ncbi:hypothetical protein [Halostella sp. PRR32]|uniref:hypothetical protein n=1 Tax=Halostella sp. PRR32 TaxID=3098147 RepID=UPI002B1E0937|nr:hypothetical protein [Halostella sp. PRR32]